VVFTGCCHRGLPNTLNCARELIGDQPLLAVLGGLHGARLSDAEMDAAIAALESAGASEVVAGHCTGDNAVAYLAKHASFPVKTFHVGTVREW
jgi:7,8-dihydropterin-6-yl-methyl-4-(beta-D-ribofuranosyl)aminobenzene 5'-phosphate synthase